MAYVRHSLLGRHCAYDIYYKEPLPPYEKLLELLFAKYENGFDRVNAIGSAVILIKEHPEELREKLVKVLSDDNNGSFTESYGILSPYLYSDYFCSKNSTAKERQKENIFWFDLREKIDMLNYKHN